MSDFTENPNQKSQKKINNQTLLFLNQFKMKYILEFLLFCKKLTSALGIIFVTFWIVHERLKASKSFHIKLMEKCNLLFFHWVGQWEQLNSKNVFTIKPAVRVHHVSYLSSLNSSNIFEGLSEMFEKFIYFTKMLYTIIFYELLTVISQI